MGRTKSPVLNTRAAPKPVEAAQASESMEKTPSGSFSSVATSSSCPNCGSTFPEMSTKDFHDHVASCTRPSTAGSGSSESTLSPPPESLRLDPASTIAVQGRDDDEGYRSVVEFGDVVDDQPGAKRDFGAAVQVNQVTNVENNSQENGRENANQGIETSNLIEKEDINGFENITIAPHVDGEFDLYEYEAIRKEDEKQDEPEAEKDDESQEILNELEDPKVSDDLKAVDCRLNLEDPVTPDNGEVVEEIEGPEVVEDIYGADTPRVDTPLRADTPTPVEAAAKSIVDGTDVLRASKSLANALLDTPAIPVALEVPAVPNVNDADIPGPSQVTINSDIPVDSEVASQIAADSEEKPEKVVIKFKKFTPITSFEEFIKDAEDMSIEELYHRTSVISDVLLSYQNEYDVVGQKLYNYESRKASEKQISDERKKEQEDKKKADEKAAIIAEDRILISLQLKYDIQLRLRGDKWNSFVDKFETMGGDKETLDRLKKLHESPFVAALIKRQRAAEKEAIPKVTLVRGDLPPLAKKDNEPHFRRRKIVQDRVAFDEKKQADVYVQNYNSKMSGNQKLVDRNAVQSGDDEFNENGRPKRSTTKRAFYDTEQSETPPDTEPENLPAKRARTKRVLDDGIASPGRPHTLFESRDGTPARVFPSGKRVGRPPGSKTKNPGAKATQSKLNTVQVASPSESEAEDGEAQNNQVESHAQALEPSQEEQLHAAASSLVAQTVEANAAAGGPTKKKHAGGRPKKKVAVEELIVGPPDAPVEEVSIAPKPKNKGGRPRKHQIPAGGAKARGGRFKKEPAAEQTSVQVGEEDEVIQSTEHDNESLFPSTSTSRPTTSSSTGTDGTFGGRQTRRAAMRTKSQAQSASVTNHDDQLDPLGPSVSTNGRTKRKRTVTENIQPQDAAQSDDGDSEGENIVVDTYRPDLEEVAPAPPKKTSRKVVRNKRGKAVAQPIRPPQEVTPWQAGDASTNTTGRPKRKRAAALPESSIDPDTLGDYLSDDDGDTPPPPKRRKGRGGRKGKYSKRDQMADIDSEDEGDSSAPPSRKRAARAVTKRSTVKREVVSEDSSGDNQVSQPPKTRKSRTNTLIVAEGAGPEVVTGGIVEGDNGEGPSAYAPKKRKARPVSKGKGIAWGDIIEAEADTIKNEGDELQNGNEDAGLGFYGHDEADELAPPTKKRKTRAVKGKAAVPESTGGDEDGIEDSEDYTGMDPTEAELLRKKKRKSRKLAAATRKRWADGSMKGPMEKRQQTNAAKKLAKLAEKAKAGGSVGPSDMMVDGPVMAGGMPAAAPAQVGDIAQEVAREAQQAVTAGDPKKVSVTKPKINPFALHTAGPALAPAPVAAQPAPARVSTRVRKPTSRLLGLDGAGDSEDENSGGEYRSEYDRYQALMSPKGSGLGKRVRKSFYDLSTFGDEEDSI